MALVFTTFGIKVIHGQQLAVNNLKASYSNKINLTIRVLLVSLRDEF